MYHNLPATTSQSNQPSKDRGNWACAHSSIWVCPFYRVQLLLRAPSCRQIRAGTLLPTRWSLGRTHRAPTNYKRRSPPHEERLDSSSGSDQPWQVPRYRPRQRSSGKSDFLSISDPCEEYWSSCFCDSRGVGHSVSSPTQPSSLSEMSRRVTEPTRRAQLSRHSSAF